MSDESASLKVEFAESADIMTQDSKLTTDKSHQGRDPVRSVSSDGTLRTTTRVLYSSW
jgi:hypothetical protein